MSEVQLVTEEVKLPKEMNEIRTAIRDLVKDIKDKKEVGALVNENLGNLITAVEGYDQLYAESKTSESYDVYALIASDLAKIFTK